MNSSTLKNSLPQDLIDIVREYFDVAWVNPNQDAIKDLLNYFCRDISEIIIDYEPKYSMEINDMTRRVSNKEFKVKYIDIDVLQVEFIPNKKLGCWLAIKYPYFLPKETIFTLDIYRELIDIVNGKDNSDESWYLNLLCPQCMPRVDVPPNTAIILPPHKFTTKTYVGYTECAGSIEWKVVNDDNKILIYHVEKCVWSFHTLNLD